MKKLAITLALIAVLLLVWMLAPEAVGQGRGRGAGAVSPRNKLLPRTCSDVSPAVTGTCPSPAAWTPTPAKD